MSQRISPLLIPSLIVSILLASWSARASAEEPLADGPLSDLHGREPVIPDLLPRPRPFAVAGSGAAELGVSLRYRRTGSRRGVGGGVHFSVPTDRWLLPPRRGPRANHRDDEAGAEPEARGAPHDARDAEAASASASLPPPLPTLRSRDVRAAVRAARRYARHQEERARLDDLAARARYAGLLPELRLRMTRLTDASASLSPTSYDADRTTESGGVSLWLEGRATWRLDRLVFAAPEPGLERLRRETERQAKALADEVVALLFAWQRHVVALYDTLLDPVACVAHALDADQHDLELDWRTGGWWRRWRERHPLPPEGRCDRLPASASPEETLTETRRRRPRDRSPLRERRAHSPRRRPNATLHRTPSGG
ncbi:MAG: hypothetical protein AAF928_19655 [Myxococcota bacterium]